MTVTSADIWQTVKQRLGLADDALELLVAKYVEEIGSRLLHYCNLDTIPDTFRHVWASITVDAVRVELPNVEEIAGTVGEGAVAVKVGDTSLSGGASGAGCPIRRKRRSTRSA